MAKSGSSYRKKVLKGDYRTKSDIPKTAREREMWKRATAIATKESGAQSEKSTPWQLVTTIYKNAKKANKVPKKSDIKKAKHSKAVASYKKPDAKRGRKK